jgi:poly-gamma-glutamate capsule biosynthesis protein CapA/YwtB (metallophosphatase superfamily)
MDLAPGQRALAGRWARAGASLVVGSHPHVLQGVERLHGAWVLYSTGNFAFPMAHGASAQTAFFEARFDGERRALRARCARARCCDGSARPRGPCCCPGRLASVT